MSIRYRCGKCGTTGPATDTYTATGDGLLTTIVCDSCKHGFGFWAHGSE